MVPRDATREETGHIHTGHIHTGHGDAGFAGSDVARPARPIAPPPPIDFVAVGDRMAPGRAFEERKSTAAGKADDPLHHRAFELRAVHVGTGQIRAGQIRLREGGAAQIGPGQ